MVPQSAYIHPSREGSKEVTDFIVSHESSECRNCGAIVPHGAKNGAFARSKHRSDPKRKNACTHPFSPAAKRKKERELTKQTMHSDSTTSDTHIQSQEAEPTRPRLIVSDIPILRDMPASFVEAQLEDNEAQLEYTELEVTEQSCIKKHQDALNLLTQTLVHTRHEQEAAAAARGRLMQKREAERRVDACAGRKGVVSGDRFAPKRARL
jgi:hypothetical protein